MRLLLRIAVIAWLCLVAWLVIVTIQQLAHMM